MAANLEQLFTGHLAVMRERADAALAASSFDHLLVYSGGLHYGFLDDNAYAFKVNPHFKRWVPVTGNPQCLLVYTPGEKPKLAFYSPVDFWHTVHPVPEDFWTAHFDIQPVASIDDAASLLPRNRDRAALIGEPAPLFREWGVKNLNPANLLDDLHYHFAWKTEYEVECMREANRLGARGHLAAEGAFRAGASEYEIHLAYLEATNHIDADLPYGNIVALNEHAAVLHHGHQSRRKPDEIRSFLIDAGCTFNGYASDITRTYSAKPDEFQQLIDRMEHSQRALCDAVKPGMEYVDLQMLAHRHVADILVEFGIATGDADALIANGVTRAFYPHGVGHYLGAQVHDVGGKIADAKGTPIPQPEDQPFLRLLRRIEIGQVFTVEPGLYFIDSLLDGLRGTDAEKTVNWKRVDEFRPYGGIRIEDNVRVTEGGHENLTRPAFAELEGEV
ncbi:MAG TPA: Xaa-Pro dipeptidase [Gammaproteobacteria bacterium]